MSNWRSIDFKLSERLRDPAFRLEWFRAQLEYGVPEQFRALREDRELTQTKLAEKADMKQSAISRFEKSSDATWNFETLLKLAEAMDAQLQISVVKAEDVIERHARLEREAEGRSSVLDAPPPESTASPSVLDAIAPKKLEPRILHQQGNRPWN